MSFPRYSTHKDSGIAWVDRIPEHWGTSAIKWVCRRYAGGTPDKANYAYWENGVIPWLNSGAINDRYITEASAFITEVAMRNSSAKWIPEGALLMALAGQGRTKGMVAQLGFRATCNQSMAALVPIGNANSRFLYWWLEANYQNIRNMAGGDLRDGLNLELIGSIACPLPPQVEQLSIAAFLDLETAKIDALIAEQQRLIELLQEKRQAVISQAVTKGLNPDAPMKDSGVKWLGEVPEHWEVMGLTKTIGPVVDYRGKTPTKSDSGTLLVTAKNIRNGEIDYSLSEEYVDPLEAEQLLQRGRPVIGDVLFTMEAPLGQVALVDREDIALAQRVVKFRGISGRMINDFLMWWLVGTHCQHQLNSLSTGSTALGIKASKLSAVTCVVPPLEEQIAINKRIRDLSKEIADIYSTARSQIDLLQERRAALISAAVTGQIDVRGLVAEEAA